MISAPDNDGLITAGTAGTQLTWMDVKVDGYVPMTPRHGKAGGDQRAVVERIADAGGDGGEIWRRTFIPAVILRKAGRPGGGKFCEGVLEFRGRVLVRCNPGERARRERAAEPDFCGKFTVHAAGQDAAESGARRGDAAVADAVRAADAVAERLTVLREVYGQSLAAGLRVSSGDCLAVVDQAIIATRMRR